MRPRSQAYEDRPGFLAPGSGHRWARRLLRFRHVQTMAFSRRRCNGRDAKGSGHRCGAGHSLSRHQPASEPRRIDPRLRSATLRLGWSPDVFRGSAPSPATLLPGGSARFQHGEGRGPRRATEVPFRLVGYSDRSDVDVRALPWDGTRARHGTARWPSVVLGLLRVESLLAADHAASMRVVVVRNATSLALSCGSPPCARCARHRGDGKSPWCVRRRDCISRSTGRHDFVVPR